MSSNIIDGKKISNEMIKDLRNKVSKLSKKPALAIINASSDLSSQIYIKVKVKACEKVGINCKVFAFDKYTSQKDIINEINNLNNDTNISAIILQLPIWDHLNKELLLNTISPLKDADGLTRYNLGKLFSNEKGIQPATAKAVLKILNTINPKDKNVVIVGRSILVSKPLMHLLLNNDYTVTMCHSKTKNLEKFTKNADILISAVGKRNFITKDMVKENSIVIDVGITREENKIYGDVSDDVKDIASYITPVPGGVGPLTVACLLENIIK